MNLRAKPIMFVASGCLVLQAIVGQGCATHSGAPAWRLVQAPDSPRPGLPRANAIAAGDVDGDGLMDVIVLGGSGELSVLVHRGEGQFEPCRQGVLRAGAGASGLGAGDLNADSFCDIVVSHHDDFDLTVLLSKGDGTFAPPITTRPPVSGHGRPHSHNLALADLDHDGHLDVVQAQSDQNVVWAFLGDGTGAFTTAPGSPYGAGSHPYTVVVADFDQDGMLDFATPNEADGTLTLGLGLGSGEFGPASRERLHIGRHPLGFAAGDLNGDGYPDLVVNHDDDSRLTVWSGDGKGAFRRVQTLSATGRCFGQLVADMNHDGILDVVAPCIDEQGVAVWLGDSVRGLSSTPSLFRTPGTDSQVMATADLNGDGLVDVVTAGWDRPTVAILLGRTRD